MRTITLSWNASASPDVVGYRVRYGTRSGDYLQVIDAGNHTTVDVPNLVEGTTYFFVITAYNASGESAPSEELTHTPNPAMFVNMSTRANVQGGDQVVIAGFIIGGSSLKSVVIRAVGPSLSETGVNGVLADPVIELYSWGSLVAVNDNWRDGDPEAVAKLGALAPNDDHEAALAITLPPGSYTVVVRGRNASTGIALLEVYDGGIPIVP